MEDQLDAYDFELPERLIAQRPAEPRDSSRLLVLDRRAGTWAHRRFTDLPEYLDAQDLLVANNTQVLKARLLGRRLVPVEGSKRVASEDPKAAERLIPGGKVEFVMLEEVGQRRWEGLFHASAKYKAGFIFEVPTPDGRGLRGTLVRSSYESPHGTVVAEFDRDPIESGAGQLPLPPYVERAPESGDDSAYQTVYASQLGSAAAPTAGLHFTPRVLEALRAKGVGWEEVTLHVGLGTFRPVKETDLSRHRMHEERYVIPAEVAERIAAAKAAQPPRRVVAVGTTSVRTLEGAWRDGRVQAGSARTSIFIRPGAHEFKVVDRMITNFHLPRSTLLMLISAFAGRELVLSAYADAVKQEYRFFSYGDAMLIL